MPIDLVDSGSRGRTGGHIARGRTADQVVEQLLRNEPRLSLTRRLIASLLTGRNTSGALSALREHVAQDGAADGSASHVEIDESPVARVGCRWSSLSPFPIPDNLVRY